MFQCVAIKNHLVPKFKIQRCVLYRQLKTIQHLSYRKMGFILERLHFCRDSLKDQIASIAENRARGFLQGKKGNLAKKKNQCSPTSGTFWSLLVFLFPPPYQGLPSTAASVTP